MDRIKSVGHTKTILELLTYSAEDRKLIDKCDHATFMGVRMKLDPALYSTEEGIKSQLDKFQLPQGLLYIAQVVDGQPSMIKVAVEVYAHRIIRQ
jgi:hypothetical protein